MNLLLDIGNTRVKWTTLDEHGLGEQQAAPYADWTEREVIEHILEPAGRAERVLVSNVGGPRIAAAVRAATLATWGFEPLFVVPADHACGVRNGYADPKQLGADRWVALLAARRYPGAVCVVSVGTAMTVDALDASGQHLGGQIVPGPDLMVAALLRNTSDLAARSRQGDAGSGFFADNTFGAIHQGAVHALAALIERAVATVKASTGSDPRLLVTGGASERVEPFIRRPFERIPDLVLRGLAVLAREPADAG